MIQDLSSLQEEAERMAAEQMEEFQKAQEALKAQLAEAKAHVQHIIQENSLLDSALVTANKRITSLCARSADDVSTETADGAPTGFILFLLLSLMLLQERRNRVY